MSASHPTFASGHCFMAEPLSKPEVEEVGDVIISYLARSYKDGELGQAELDRFNKILRKMDHPTFDKVL